MVALVGVAGIHVATSFFLSVGDGGTGNRRGHGPYPRTCHLNRHHGRTATWSTCVDTSYNGWDPVTMRQIWGQGTATTAGAPLTDRIRFLRFGYGGTDPVRGPRRLLPYAADSRRPVLAFLPPSFAWLLVPAAVKAGYCAARAYLYSYRIPPVCTAPVFVFPPVSSSLWHCTTRVLGKTYF